VKEGQGFTIWAGESKTVTVTVTDADTGSGVNLVSSCVAWKLCTLVQGTYSGSTLLTKDSDWTGACGITISGCTFSFPLTHGDTDALKGTYYQEAEIKDAAGSSYKPMRGYVAINQGAI